MRLVAAALVLALGAAPIAAQRVETLWSLGVRAPIGGELVVPVPIPAQVGFASLPTSFSETTGIVVGADARISLIGALGLRTGLSVTRAQRVIERGPVAGCRRCSTTLVSGLLGVSLRQPISARLQVEAAVGGELIHLGGEAYAQPLDVHTGANVVPTGRVVGGTNASLGSVLALRRAGAIRLDGRLRRYHITSRWTDPARMVNNPGAIESRPYTDLLVTIGWSPRAIGAPSGRSARVLR
jgi:hypothetical protein